jgi:protection-of-telomeres protein 1
MLSGAVSLLTNFSTRFHVLSASSVPRDLAGVKFLPWTSWPASHANPALPKCLEAPYIIWAIEHKLELGLPSNDQFKGKSNTSTNINTSKFRLLKDVQDGHWYNILGQIIQIPATQGNMSGNPLTVYLSDYTPNTRFYNHAEPEGEEEDDYGYGGRKPPPKTSAWPGPYGKMSIQLSVWDHQADFLRGKEGEWVLMRNVQIKMWDGVLEGVLRNDHSKSEGTLLVDLMQMSEDPDPRFKEAVRRKRDYESKSKARAKALKDGTTSSGNKRKPDEEHKKPNSKQRRKEQRAAALQKGAETELKTLERSYLNENSE